MTDLIDSLMVDLEDLNYDLYCEMKNMIKEFRLMFSPGTIEDGHTDFIEHSLQELEQIYPAFQQKWTKEHGKN